MSSTFQLLDSAGALDILNLLFVRTVKLKLRYRSGGEVGVTALAATIVVVASQVPVANALNTVAVELEVGICAGAVRVQQIQTIVSLWSSTNIFFHGAFRPR